MIAPHNPSGQSIPIMPPSRESQALKTRFEAFSANFPQDGNHFLERCVYDQVQKAGAEASGVTFQDVMISADGLDVPCKWVRPDGTSASKHVILFMHGGGFRWVTHAVLHYT